MIVHILSSCWGSFKAPKDLIDLWNKAEKVLDLNTWGDEEYMRSIPDVLKPSGQAYYARERELLRAIDIIYAAGWEIKS